MNSINRSIGIGTLVALGAFAMAQSSHTGGPVIVRPSSDYARPGHFKTNYLINQTETAKNRFLNLLIASQPRYGNGIRPMGGPGPTGGGVGMWPAGYHPLDIHLAYNIPQNLGSNAIAIVDAYDDPNSLYDFNYFSSTFNLPTEPSTVSTLATNKVFQVVYAGGAQPLGDPGWGEEMSLDIEWAHSMAPNAKIYLVEAQDSSTTSLYNAILVASTLPGVKEVSMSFGADDAALGSVPGLEQQLDAYFTTPGIVYMASSGDSAVASYPATSPNVVGVGGTSLYLDANDNLLSEQGWAGSGGGISVGETIPSYQMPLNSLLGGMRGSPDISGPADPNTGCAVYDSFEAGGWSVIGGTSWACPTEAGITNARGLFNSTSGAELTKIYGEYANANVYASLYRDIVLGGTFFNNCGTGYDLVTGIGSAVNLYPTIPPIGNYPPSSVTPITGNVLSGNVASLAAADGNDYDMGSVLFGKLGMVSAYQTNYTIGLPVSNYTGIQVAVKALSNSQAVIQLYAWNYVSGVYDYIGAKGGSVSAVNYLFVLPANWQNYVDPSGNMQLLTRCVNSPRRGQLVVNAQLDTDLINVQTVNSQ